jgi:hypothetical protein
LPNLTAPALAAFKSLMEAFYERGFKSGLPYKADGTPTATGGVSYADYVRAFRDGHRLSANANAREVCVLCGGPLGATPQVDHWIAKATVPLLSVSADNLLPSCGDCNSSSNKGQKEVHTLGSFVDWFHPYLRPGSSSLQLTYALPSFHVQCTAIAASDSPKVNNLDALLNLTSRWTREFKAEYAKHQDVLKRRERDRIRNAEARHTQAEIHSYVQQWIKDLPASEPHYEVHSTLAAALQQPPRLQAWHMELSGI